MPSILALRNAVTWIQEAPAEIRMIIDDFTAEDLELRNTGKYSDAYRRQLRDTLREATSQDLDAVTDALTRHQATLTAPAPADPRPAVEQLLDEQRQTKAWDRAKLMLDAGSSPSEVIKSATTEGDLHTLRALRSELPSHVANARGRDASHEERLAASATITRLVDLALAEVMPDGIERAALRGRLHWNAYGPIVTEELTRARRLVEGRRDAGIGSAITLHYLRDETKQLASLTV
jgi:hypothetical protein